MGSDNAIMPFPRRPQLCCCPHNVAALTPFLFEWVFVSNVDSVFAPMTDLQIYKETG